MIDKNGIKNQMMSMWSNEFHDSTSYIDMLFDNYFDINNVIFEKEGRDIISSMISIPYFLNYKKYKNIKGLYLCGLNTLPNFRNKGIMSNLINRMERRALSDNFDFLCLIPADNNLRIYYKKIGFEDVFYRSNIIYKYNLFVDSIKSEISKYNGLRVVKITAADFAKNRDFYSSVLAYFIDKENSFCSPTLCHSQKDFKNIITENTISGGDVFVVQNNNNGIEGVMFCFENNETIDVRSIFYETDFVRQYMLSWLFENRRVKKIEVNYFKEQTDFLGDEEKAKLVLKQYGMAKILKPSEVLKILARKYIGPEFSILINEDEKGKIYGVYGISKNGVVENREDDNCSGADVVMTLGDLTKLFFCGNNESFSREMLIDFVNGNGNEFTKSSSNMALMFD